MIITYKFIRKIFILDVVDMPIIIIYWLLGTQGSKDFPLILHKFSTIKHTLILTSYISENIESITSFV